MVAKELISQTVPPLKMSDTGQKALNWMSDFQVRHLPVVNEERFVGLISEDDILDYNRTDFLIDEYPKALQRPSIDANEHIFEVVKTAVNLQLSIIPVIDGDNKYLGGITLKSLLQYFAESTSLNEPGSVLVLEVTKRNYSLHEIARIVESEGAQILSSFITSRPHSDVLEITIKLNTQYIERIIATFERFEYIIRASYQESDYLDSLKDRYDSLMSYLNV